MPEDEQTNDHWMEPFIGPVSLVTGEQYQMLHCTCCGQTEQKGRYKTWSGPELEKLRREAGVSEEDLREAIAAEKDLYDVMTTPGPDGSIDVPADYEAIEMRALRATRKVCYMPRNLR
jgi:hypothetical protein